MVLIGRKRVSMQDIARELNISKAAVSFALGGKPGVSDAMRELIFDTAVKMGYPTSDPGKNKNILLILDDGREKDSEFFYAAISHSLRYTQMVGYNLLVANVSTEFQGQNMIPKVFYDIEARGVIFAGNIMRNYVETFLDANIPSVLMVQHLYGLKTDNVVSANEEGGYALTRYLLDKGHRKIGFFADISVFDSFSKRRAGYRKALSDAGIRPSQYECVFSSGGERPSDATIEPHMENVMQFYAKPAEAPTAWVCGNDFTAIALINQLRKRGLKVPGDISIVGFDALPAAASFHPVLTTYDARIELLVKNSIDLLIRHIENDGQDWNPVQISVLGNIIEGDSVKELSESAS